MEGMGRVVGGAGGRAGCWVLYTIIHILSDDVRVRFTLDPQFGVQDIPLGDGLEPAPILVNIEIMLDMGFLAKLVTLFQEGRGGEERVEQGGGEGAGDEIA